ncbi:adenylate/guanylate cyclase domain-containing protein [Myxococcaceae bacterium GXIMD 01537]
MKTANLAIVFTDIKGFTERTSRQTLEENQRLLQVHHQLLAPLFRAFGGRIVKSIGDAFLVTFESPTQAVLSGIAIQDRLWQHNRATPEAEQLHVRVAINVGEVRVESGDVFGEPVNIAARVEGIAEAGEVYFTEAVYLAMNKAEVPSQEVGAFELKGIPGKIRVFRVPPAPYRVEAPASEGAPAATAAREMPPFGNLALSRVQESSLAAASAEFTATAAVLGQRMGQRAATLTTQAKSTGGRLLDSLTAFLSGLLASRGIPVTRRGVGVGLGVVALLLGGALLFGKSPTRRAIDAVKGVPTDERKPLVDKARALIAEEKSPGRRKLLSGLLHEAMESYGSAASDYEAAYRAHEDDGEDRLLEMLGHENCAARSAAAEALGDLKLKSARGDLEDLAEDGGKDDGASGGFLGLGRCDSKAAAKAALKRLGAD